MKTVMSRPDPGCFGCFFLGIAAVLLAACATTDPALEAAGRLAAEGRPEDGLRVLEETLRREPDNRAVRAEFLRRKELFVAQASNRGDAARAAGDAQAADAAYRKALEWDAASPRARAGLMMLEAQARHSGLVAEAQRLVDARQPEAAGVKLRVVLAEDPRHREARALLRRIEEQAAQAASAGLGVLKASLDKPISLEFRDANLRAVLEVVARTAGINILFDHDVRADLKTSVFVRNTRVEEALGLILLSNQLDKKVVNENTLIVYPNTPAKQRNYQDLMVKAFYLANADVKQTLAMIRAIVKTRDAFIDEKLSLLVIRDTPQAVRLAEKLIAAQDLAEPEVMLEVEVLEVSRNRMQELGLRWPDQIGYGVLQGSTQSTTLSGGISQTVTNPGGTLAPGFVDLRNRTGLTTFTANPPLVLNLKAQDGKTNLLANPRIRVKNKEKAKIHIGDKVPVITTTAAVSGGFVSSNVSYLDVGLKLDVEPQVFLEDEVGIKVSLEVSNIVKEISVSGSSGNTVAFQIGTRTATTLLRLRDGETQVLAGLINDEDRALASKVPGLGDLPIVGRLFSSHKDERVKSEIVLLITPRIVRGLARPEAAVSEFLSGTEAAVGSAAARAAQAAPAQPSRPLPLPAPAAAPAAPGGTMIPFPGAAPSGADAGTAAPAASPRTGIFRRAPVVLPAPVTGAAATGREAPSAGGN